MRYLITCSVLFGLVLLGIGCDRREGVSRAVQTAPEAPGVGSQEQPAKRLTEDQLRSLYQGNTGHVKSLLGKPADVMPEIKGGRGYDPRLGMVVTRYGRFETWIYNTDLGEVRIELLSNRKVANINLNGKFVKRESVDTTSPAR